MRFNVVKKSLSSLTKKMFIFTYFCFFNVFNAIYCLNLNEKLNDTIINNYNFNKTMTINNDNDNDTLPLINMSTITYLSSKSETKRDVSISFVKRTDNLFLFIYLANL